MACGGQTVEDDTAALGGGGQTSTVTPGGGGTTTAASTSTTTAVPICLGMPPQATTDDTCRYKLDLPAFAATDTTCLTWLPINPTYMLSPEKLTLYFSTSAGSRFEIPYVGTLANCASATTYGGWYATNTSGGSTEIGLCGCTCNAAHLHAFYADVACDGIPTG